MYTYIYRYIYICIYSYIYIYRWGVKTDKTLILDAIENLILKYFNDDSDNQVSLSEVLIQKTKKRINLVHLYGPAVFDEV
jgi:hypothetical protein